ncbi:hypothetical protein KA005_13950 [bacterium]|nr:hypothetical protein [bacterium]
MEKVPLSPWEIIKRTKDVPKILNWSRNKHLLVSGPEFWGVHHIFIDSALKHCVFVLKADLTTHIFIGNPVKAQEWKKYNENFCLALSKKLKVPSLKWKIYQDYVLYKGTMLPPKQISEEPYFGKVIQVEEFTNQTINDEWIVKKIKELYNK